MAAFRASLNQSGEPSGYFYNHGYLFNSRNNLIDVNVQPGTSCAAGAFSYEVPMRRGFQPGNDMHFFHPRQIPNQIPGQNPIQPLSSGRESPVGSKKTQASEQQQEQQSQTKRWESTEIRIS